MGKFRINRAKVGLTYSCPVTAEENPILGMKELKDFLFEIGGTMEKYIVAEEKHESGKKHYHAYVKYGQKIDTSDERFFDFCGVHPNIINPNEKGWSNYCGKHGVYITNFWEANVFKEASKKRTWQEANDYLWEKRPEFMFKFANTAEANWRKNNQKNVEGRVYFGPFQYPQDWDPETECLVLHGVPGTGKTQMAKYIASHLKQEVLYISGPIDKAKSYYKGQGTIIWDNIVPYEEKWNINDWCALVDAKNGGSINLRYKPLDLQPGPRILIHNDDLDLPNDPKIKHRIKFIEIKG